MYEEHDHDSEPTDRKRITSSTRLRSAKISRASRRRKSTSATFGGKHKRRNKHWSW